MFVAFFPTLILFLGVLASLAFGWEEVLQEFRGVLPPGSRRAVVDSLLQLLASPGRPILAGAIGTILLGSQLTYSFRRVFGSIYKQESRMGFWRQQVQGLGVVMAMLIPWVALSLLLIFGNYIRNWLVIEWGIRFNRLIQILWSAGYVGATVLIATLVLSVLYHFLTPERTHRWDNVLPGAVLAVVLWWIVTTGFAYYVRHLAIYSLLFGGFAGAIGLLIWMYLTAVVILAGAHFNAKLAQE